ncbi:glycosyltransferase family 2 protein [Kineococcus sp. TBRC 1896]|uniref:Glycosyltransferase family 2 protein n=1 Tax=Kineococcus mangrovi TaxID=1660183 RepID=A0ABV4HW59_9ACTN
MSDVLVTPAPRTGGRAAPVTVTVVVCAYTLDRWDDLVAGLGALQRQTRPVEEVLLVVDHAPDLLARARTALGPAATVLENVHERGLSGARNTGSAAATGDVVLFLDDDARPDADWVAAGVAAFADDDVVGTGGTAVPAWDAPGRPAWFPEPFLWVVGCSYEGLPGDGGALRNPIGASMGFRRADLLAAGGFTTGIGRVGRHPVGCEETELSIRVRQRRGGTARIVHTRGAVVHHRVRRDRATVGYFLRRCFWEGFSKAVVAAAVGAQDALSSERSYASRVLPGAVLRGLRSTATGRGSAGLQQAAAVVAGFCTTAAGYGYGLCTRRSRSPRRTATGAGRG